MNESIKFQLIYAGQKEAFETLLRKNVIKPEWVEFIKIMIKDIEKDITHPTVLKELESIKKEIDEKLR